MKNKMIEHHVSDRLLMAYALGDLSQGLSVAVATHISMCDQCRAQAESFEAVGGACLDEENAAEQGVHSTLDDIFARSKEMEQSPEPNSLRSDVPAPLDQFLDRPLADLKWRKLGMGVRQHILCDDGESSARLLYIPAGTGIPDHGHSGVEMTLVLKGAFIDGDMRFAAGDIEEVDDETAHTPVADFGEDCICLAATEGLLQFKSLVPRLMQPLLRI